MNTSTPNKLVYTEADVQKAISTLRERQHTSIRRAARAFGIPYTTLWNRMAGHTSRFIAHESEQVLSNAEERTLVRWITRLTRTGFPASPALVVQMAEELRRGRV